MKRFTSVFALGLAASLALSACGAKDVATDAAGTAADTVGGAVEATGDMAGKAVEGAGDTVAAAGDAAGDMAGGAMDAVKDAAGGAAGGVMALKDGVTGMTSSITSTVDAVKSGDFAGAKESFASVESAWETMKAAVPGDAAGGIQEKITEISTGLASDAPNSESLLSSLGGLTDLVGGLGQ